MKYLFEVDGVRALEAFAMANTLVAFDYDGTLAPIVDEPSNAIMRPETIGILENIVSLAPVAVISGRSRADVLKFLDTKVDYVIGNHGLEGLPSGASTLSQANSSCQKWIAFLQQFLKVEGVVVEDKHYSIAIHYRKSSDKKSAKINILNICASIAPAPRIVMGKFVVNLVSVGAPHKGVAMLELMLKMGCRSAIYFGDDDNDEDVFSLAEESILTIKVGDSSDSSALFYVHDQSEIDKAMLIIEKSMRRCGKSHRQISYFGEQKNADGRN